MARNGSKVIAKDSSFTPGFHQPGSRSHNPIGKGKSSFSMILHDDLKQLIGNAKANEMAVMDWQETGFVLIAEKNDSGNLEIRQVKRAKVFSI